MKIQCMKFLFKFNRGFRRGFRSVGSVGEAFLISLKGGSEFSSYKIELRKMTSHLELLTRLRKKLNFTRSY